jgi:hypothetical protein
LTDPADREACVAQVRRAVRPGGHVIVAAFGPDGPLQCSGLPVARYAPDALHAEFPSGWTTGLIRIKPPGFVERKDCDKIQCFSVKHR